MDIEYSKKAAKTINNLDNKLKQRIQQAILGLPDGDVKRIIGRVDTWRLRVGDWRVLFSQSDNDTILIEKISTRGQAYKGGFIII